MHPALCFDIFFAGIFIIGLLFRFLRLILGSKVKSAKKVIVIIGATSGSGLALAKRFYRKGFSVVATYHNSKESGYAELEEIIKEQGVKGQDGPKMFLVYMEVRSEQSIDIGANEIEGLISKSELELFSVICNAGVCLDCPLELVQRDSMNKTMQTNIFGTVMVAKRFIKPIIKSKGRIVVVSSIIHSFYGPTVPVYAATKGAVKSFAGCLDENLKSYGASCRCVVPGNLMNKSNMKLGTAATLRDSLAKLGPEERELYKKNIEETNRAVGQQLKMRVSQLREDPERAAEVYSIESPEVQKDVGLARKLRDWVFTYLDGSQNSRKSKPKDVEEMGALTAFDYAVLLKDPPRRC